MIDSLILNSFNLFYTALPILAIAILDRDLGDTELLDHPQVYASGRANTGFNGSLFWSWVGTAVRDSCVVFWVWLLSNLFRFGSWK